MATTTIVHIKEQPFSGVESQLAQDREPQHDPSADSLYLHKAQVMASELSLKSSSLPETPPAGPMADIDVGENHANERSENSSAPDAHTDSQVNHSTTPTPCFPNDTCATDTTEEELIYPSGSPVLKREFLMSLEDVTACTSDSPNDAPAEVWRPEELAGEDGTRELNEASKLHLDRKDTTVASINGDSHAQTYLEAQTGFHDEAPGKLSRPETQRVSDNLLTEDKIPDQVDDGLGGDAELSLGELSHRLSRMADQMSSRADLERTPPRSPSPTLSERSTVGALPDIRTKSRNKNTTSRNMQRPSTPRPRSPPVHRNAAHPGTRLQYVDPYHQTMFQRSWSIKRRDIPRLRSGRKFEIRHDFDPDVAPTVQGVSEAMLNHFCGRRNTAALVKRYLVEQSVEESETEDEDDVDDDKRKVKDDVLMILDSAAHHTAVARIIRYMRRCCKPSTHKPQHDLITPPALRDAVQTIRACRIFGLGADADRLREFLANHRIPNGMLSVEDVEWIWEGLDGQMRRSTFADALLCYIVFDVIGYDNPKAEQIQALLSLDEYSELRERANREISDGKYRVETKQLFLDRQKQDRSKRKKARTNEERASVSRDRPREPVDDDTNEYERTSSRLLKLLSAEAMDAIDASALAGRKRNSLTLDKRTSSDIRSEKNPSLTGTVDTAKGKVAQQATERTRSTPAPAPIHDLGTMDADTRTFDGSGRRQSAYYPSGASHTRSERGRTMKGVDMSAGGRRGHVSSRNEGKNEAANPIAAGSRRTGEERGHPLSARVAGDPNPPPRTLHASRSSLNLDKPLPTPPSTRLPPSRSANQLPSERSLPSGAERQPMRKPEEIAGLEVAALEELLQRPVPERTSSNTSTSLIPRSEPCPTCGRRSPRSGSSSSSRRSSRARNTLQKLRGKS